MSLAVFARYFVAGSIAAGVHLLSLALLIRLGCPALAASMLGFCIALVVNYALQYYWTFRHSGSHVTAFTRYVTVNIGGFVLNAIVFHTIDSLSILPPVVTQAITILIVFVFNFVLNASFSFASPQPRK